MGGDAVDIMSEYASPSETGSRGAHDSRSKKNESPKSREINNLAIQVRTRKRRVSADNSLTSSAFDPPVGGDGGLTASIPVSSLASFRKNAGSFRETSRVVQRIKWIWGRFTIESRPSDKSFTLHHWMRDTELNTRYPYSRFGNQPAVLIPETKEEWDQILVKEYNVHGWNRLESKRVLDLVQQFDTRFPVVLDCWMTEVESSNAALGSGKVETLREKTIVEIKSRFYEIQRCLAVRRNLTQHASVLYRFDCDRDNARRRQWELLFNRTRSELLEEQCLLGELKRIETMATSGEDDGMTSTQLSGLTGTQSLHASGPQKSSVSNPAAPAVRKKNPSWMNLAPRPLVGGRPRTPRMPVIPAASSVATLTLAPAAAERVERILRELGVPPPAPPSFALLGLWNEIRRCIVMAMDSQRVLNRKKYDEALLESQFKLLRTNLLDSGVPESSLPSMSDMIPANSSSGPDINAMDLEDVDVNKL